MRRVAVLFVFGGLMAAGLLTAAQPGAKSRPASRSPRQLQTGPKAAPRGAKPVQPVKPGGAQQAGQQTGVWDDTDIAHAVKEGTPAKPSKPGGAQQAGQKTGVWDDTDIAHVVKEGKAVKPVKPGDKLTPQGAGPKQTSPQAGLSDDTVGAGVSTGQAKLKKAEKKPGGK